MTRVDTTQYSDYTLFHEGSRGSTVVATGVDYDAGTNTDCHDDQTVHAYTVTLSHIQLDECSGSVQKPRHGTGLGYFL